MVTVILSPPVIFIGIEIPSFLSQDLSQKCRKIHAPIKLIYVNMN
jgi:hypothetical protein